MPIKIEGFLSPLKEYFRNRSMRRKMWADALFLIRLEQMERGVLGYIRTLEQKVDSQADEIRLLRTEAQDAYFARIDADLDRDAEVPSLKTEIYPPRPWVPGVCR